MKAAERINYLFNRYRNRTISSVEFDELLVWLYNLDEEQANALADSQKALWQQAKEGKLESNSKHVNWDHMLTEIMKEQDAVPLVRPVRKLWPRVAAAVAVLSLLCAGALYIWNSNKKQEKITETKPALRQPETVVPLTNQTILTLADGRRILLDSIADGNVVSENLTYVEKMRDGELYYKGVAESRMPEYHTILVPRGGRPYRLLLADGSKIWLNAESSLRYPSFFTGDSRTVEITGEGYFEIAKDAARPFHVKFNNMDVQVLGTHFNVNTYEDESDIKVTLLEGSVQISNLASRIPNPESRIPHPASRITKPLKPGQQAVVAKTGESIDVVQANTALAVAWVKGYFQFDKADVKTILRQVGRWYDLDIEYQGKVPDDLFSGKIERNLPLTGIVKLLEQGKINVRVEGKKLIVE